MGGKRGQRARLTVDGDGNALVENVTVGALEGRDLAQLVELQVLGGGLGGVDIDDVELEVVGLRNGADGRAPGVVLRECVNLESRRNYSDTLSKILPRMCRACRKPLLRICRLHKSELMVESKKEGSLAGSTFKKFCVGWTAGFQAGTAFAPWAMVQVVDWLGGWCGAKRPNAGQAILKMLPTPSCTCARQRPQQGKRVATNDTEVMRR